MKLDRIIVPTKIARSGMRVREVFDECARLSIQSLPFADAHGRITGRVTLKNVMTDSFLPDYMVATAFVLRDELASIEKAEAKAKLILGNPIDDFVGEPHVSVPSDTSALKALAVMVQHDTSYVFVIDGDGDAYRGIVTIQGIARRLVELGS